MSISTALTLGLATDSGGIYRQAAAGATVDNIFIFTDGVNKWEIADKKGVYVARYGGVLPGTDQTSRLNAILAHSLVYEVVFDDGDITISGTLTVPTGKKLTFKNNGKLIGSGTINGGIVDADYTKQIFGTSLHTNIQSVSGDRVSVCWWGALPDGSIDCAPIVQKILNEITTKRNCSNVYYPAIGGVYRHNKGILIYRDIDVDGQAEFSSLKIFSDAQVYDGSLSGGAILQFYDNQDFGIAIQRGKGVLIQGLQLLGQNFAGYSITTTQLDNPATVFVTSGCRDTGISPHAAINIDPFSNSSSGGYPNWLSYYTQGSIGASTEVKIIDCTMRQWVVGIANSINGFTQNAECHVFDNLWIDYCKVCIANGQAQAKEVLVRNLKCWGGVETVFDCRSYGASIGAGLMVDGVNIAGSIRWLCKPSGFGTSIDRFTNIFAESIYGLGGGVADSTRRGRVVIDKSEFDFIGTDNTYWIGCCMLGSFGSLVLTNCYMAFYSLTDASPLIVDADTLSQHNCTGAVVYRASRLEELSISGNVAPFRKLDHSFISLGNALSDSGYSVIHGSRMASNDYGYVPNGTTQEKKFYGPDVELIYSYGDCYSKSGNQMTVQFAGGRHKVFKVGAQVSAAIADKFFTSITNISFGTVLSVDDANQRVTFVNVRIDRFTVSTAYSFYVLATPSQKYPLGIVGDITSGSNVITNCIGELGFNPTNFFYGTEYIFHDAFPLGTYIVSLTSTTMVLSQNAVFSEVDSYIFCTNKFIQESYSGELGININVSVAYKKGAYVHNTPTLYYPTTDNSILGWLCVKSGILTISGRTPTFVEIRADAPRIANTTAADNLQLRMFYDTTDKVFKFKQDTTWVTIPAGGGGLDSYASNAAADTAGCTTAYFNTASKKVLVRDTNGNWIEQNEHEGFEYIADLSSTADADPGGSKLRFNNATQASATILYVDTISLETFNLSTLLDGGDLVNSYLTLRSRENTDTFQIWKITSVTSATGYRKLGVSLIGNVGSFSADEMITLSIDHAGSGGGSVTKPSLIETLGYLPSPLHQEIAENYGHNREFMCIGTAIIRIGNSYVYGDNITYAILTGADSHGSMMFRSAEGDSGTARMKVLYPKVKKVYNVSITPDESFAGYGIFCGATVDVDNMLVQVSRPAPFGVTLQGDGSGGWTKTPGSTGPLFTVTSFNTGDGSTSFNVDVSTGSWDYDMMNIAYDGPNRYFIKRVYSGLGAYNAKFIILDNSGAALTSNPTTSDRIMITGGGTLLKPVNMYYYNADNSFLGTSFNFWLVGFFEKWMIASPISATEIIVRWQTDYPSATNYKIYRDTSETFSSPTLIHTGTSGTYKDTGLTTNTMYYYKMVAVVGSDVDVTIFRCKTF